MVQKQQNHRPSKDKEKWVSEHFSNHSGSLSLEKTPQRLGLHETLDILGPSLESCWAIPVMTEKELSHMIEWETVKSNMMEEGLI